MNKVEHVTYEKIISIKEIKTDYTYDFAVKDEHRIIARNEGSINSFYTSNCWHPDIEEFITAKQTPGRLTKFNMSVLVTDALMNAVKNGLSWDLEFPDYEAHPQEYKALWDGDLQKWKDAGYTTHIFKTYENASQLWDIIMSSTYNRNEPGVLFIDTINKLNNLHYCEHINATNPCLTGDSIITCSAEKTLYEILETKYPSNVTLGGHAEERIIFSMKIEDIAFLYKNDPTNLPQVQTYNEKTGVVEWKDVKWADLTRKNADLIEIELEDGRTLKLTPDHKVFTFNRGWIAASDLTKKDELINRIG